YGCGTEAAHVPTLSTPAYEPAPAARPAAPEGLPGEEVPTVADDASAAALPPPPRFRLLAVYLTAARILLSYARVWLGGKLRGAEWRERALLPCHRANARRLRDTIVAVQGLFIKVGQLLSILANALPADFRGELEALQDRIPARPLADIR